MRIGGMASGMDTEKMVKDLMRAERVKVNKYFRQEESLKWKREALNTTNKTLAEFLLKTRSDFGLTRTTSTGSIINGTTSSFDWVKNAVSSNESIVKTTASANAMAGNHKIEVEKLADVASVTIDDLSTLMASGGDFSITVGKDEYGNKKTASISVNASATMTDIVKLINEAKDDISGKSIDVRAAYDSSLDKLIINTKGQGEKQAISITGTITAFGEGQDAVVYLNGDATPIKKDSNNFSIYGINFQLQNAKVGEVVNVKVDTNVDGMYDKVKAFVDDYNAMIDVVNNLTTQKNYRDFTPLTSEEKEGMSEKEVELWESKAKSGLLRNDESLNMMTQSMRSGLYQTVYETGSGKDGTKISGFNHITQIGITTGNYRNGGKLEIDENKLRAAINENPDGVVNLLFKTSDIEVKDADGKVIKSKADEKYANTGLVQRMYEDMIVGMKDIVRRSGTGDDASLFRNVRSNMLIDFVTSGSISILDKDITSIGTRMAREEILLASKEERYWRQFTAMEKAMQKMNSQSSWLASQLGQMG